MKNLMILLIFCFTNLSCSKKNPTSDFLVVTGIAPIADLVFELSGGLVSVVSLVDPRQDPHHINLKPSDAVKIEKSDMIFAVDKDFDHVLVKSVKDTSKLVLLYSNSVDDSLVHNHQHNHNPHIWLSFRESIAMAERISEELSAKLPQHSELFQSNTVKFKTQILELLKLRQQQYVNKTQFVGVVQCHPAWDFMIGELGLQSLGVVEKVEGVQPSLKKVQKLIQTIDCFSGNVLLIKDSYAGSAVLDQISQETQRPVLIFNPMVSPNGSFKIFDILSEYSELMIN
ncbi:MAG: metal ABC transporter substrate-binding protein [Brevinemataceae bacterium]